MICPSCTLDNHPSTQQCTCGYPFSPLSVRSFLRSLSTPRRSAACASLAALVISLLAWARSKPQYHADPGAILAALFSIAAGLLFLLFTGIYARIVFKDAANRRQAWTKRDT